MNFRHKFIFFGTPDFAAIILDKLIAADWIPAAVITQPDKPAGRRQILEQPPVKKLTEKLGLPAWQPDKLKGNGEIAEKIRATEPDLVVVAAYGKIIPTDILSIPKFGCLNVHPSLLPKYRGPSPIQSAILNGDAETGVTIMLVDEEMDHGPILARRELKFPISNFQFPNKSQNSKNTTASGGVPPAGGKSSKVTYGELSKKLAELGAELLIETLPKWLNGEIKPVPQNNAEATYTKIIAKEDGLIDWNLPAEEIERQVRAFQEWPVAFTKIGVGGQAKILKIFQATVSESEGKKRPGEIFVLDKKPAVACGLPAGGQGKKSLILEEVQLEGKNKTSGADFLRGHASAPGGILGS